MLVNKAEFRYSSARLSARKDASLKLDRRNFLKFSISATGPFVLGLVPISKLGPGLLKGFRAPQSNGDRKAILYDSAKCIGCRLCEVACRNWNELPEEEEPEPAEELSAAKWNAIKTTELETDGVKVKFFSKLQCMHCTEASCVSVCPTGAASHYSEFVEIDQDWCIGCAYCLAACPFTVPHTEPPKGTARKCTLCSDRVPQGLLPACVEICPTAALTFGDRAELITGAKARVDELVAGGQSEACLYGETELGGLGVMQVLQKPPSFYGIPEAPRQATNNVFIQWAGGIATAIALAAIPFMWIFKRGRQIEEKEQYKVEGGTK